MKLKNLQNAGFIPFGYKNKYSRKPRRPDIDALVFEGLITSQPAWKVLEIVKKRYPLIDCFRDRNNVFIIGSANITNDIIEDLSALFNTLGYFSSEIITRLGDKIITMKPYEYINEPFDQIKIVFEPKFDIEEYNIPTILFHVAPKRSIEKILKIGLTPKSRSKRTFHPERVYLVKNKRAANSLRTNFVNDATNELREYGNSLSDWGLLKIDTSRLDTKLFKLFIDPNFKQYGKEYVSFFTLNTIPPKAISVDDFD